MAEWASGLKTGFVFSLSVLVLHYFVEFEKILILVEDLSPRMLVFVIIISFLRPFVGGFRTIYAVSPFGNITHMDASIGYFISAYGSIFLPSAIGGDVLRMEHIAKTTSLARKTSLYVIGIERIMGLASLIVIFLLMSLVIKNNLDISTQVFFVLAIIIGGVGLLLSPFFFKRWKEGGILGTIIESGGIRTLAPIFVISIAFQAIYFLVPISIALSFGGMDAAVGIALITPIIGIITTLPISLGGLGLREASYAAMSPLVGVDSEIAFLCGLSLSCSAIFVGLPGPFFQGRLIQVRGKRDKST